MASTGIDLTSACWRKSSYSNGTGGDCVEVAEGFPGAARWRKSSYSSGDGGNCVEVADGLDGVVPVRDSKRPHGPAVVVSAAAWVPFVRALKAADPSH
ncbi:DUF397 domain-containing protein [Streptomyces antarcticus]|uniref:DUF397 domain-containing protein n=1 Tax=Streptomyces antarcticus TaxID=2996458 RepID=UPI00227062BF|nr:MULTISPECIES: DUF397 domain-containing protein [unclassified Streptomyces]MCY0947109.1 DUF397 domain-containing protein [Streptomyces sp. H34-AA3]MCZ4085320.1 DUF397 domain-containing protein [Streptomyces sp. H34-S5]